MNPNKIREFAASFQKSRILLSGFELDLFTNIDESGGRNRDSTHGERPSQEKKGCCAENIEMMIKIIKEKNER